MKKTNSIIFIIIIAGVLLSCKQNKIKKSFKFPFDIGNEWTYKRTQELKNVSPNHDSITNTHDTTIVYEVKVILNKYINEETGEETIQVESILEDQYGVTRFYEYYLHTDQGLYLSSTAHSACIDYIYLFPHGLSKYFGTNIYNSEKNKLVSVDKFTLQYPLEIGSTWTCDRTNDELIKEVVSKEEIIFGSEKYECFKINYNNIEDPGSTATEYISNLGLMKRDIYIPNINISNKAVGDYYETFELIDYDLK